MLFRSHPESVYAKHVGLALLRYLRGRLNVGTPEELSLYKELSDKYDKRPDEQ